MRHLSIAAVFVVGTASISLTADAADSLAKEQVWQETLEHCKFTFSESQAGVMYSLSQYGGDCKVHIITDPKAWPTLTFKFERDGQEILALVGHKGSVFRTVKNVLYFAHFSFSTYGCTVAAYDLNNGKKLWETKLNAAGTGVHSAYWNQVTMGLSNSPDNEGDGIVSITGREEFGDYIEILDQKTGRVLAHKRYRTAFGTKR